MALRLFGVACLLAMTPPVGAQDPAPPPGTEDPELEEVIVTATRLPTEANRLPFAVARVEREEIQVARQQLGLDEALAGVPGVFFQNRYNFAQDLRIAIRGFGARADFGIRGIRLVADGIPLTLPDGQGSVDSIDLGSAESIEVLRGPFSAVYGAASGGVILIRSEEGPAEPFASARLNSGSYEFGEAQLKTGGQAGDFNYLANVSAMRLDGYREHSETERYLLNARMRHRFDERTKLTVVVNAVDSPQADDPGGLTAAEAAADPRQAAPRNVQFDAGESLDQQSLGAALSTSYSGGAEMLLHAHLVNRDFSNRLPFDVNANGQGGSVDLGRRFHGLGGRWTLPFAAGARLVVGAEYAAQRDRRVRFANNFGVLGPLTTDQDEDVTDYAAFVQAMWPLGERLTANAGLRYDELDYSVRDRLGLGGSGDASFSALSPMAGASWAFSENATIYGNVSRSFDPPATTELANPEAATGFNQALDEQTATNFEVGVKGEENGYRYELAMFHIAVDDAIVPFELAASGQTFYENAGSSRHEGIETSASRALTDSLDLSLSYTWSDFTFDRFEGLDGAVHDGNRIPGIPRHLVQGELHWQPRAGWFGAFDVLHASSFYADNANRVEAGDYTVANLRFEYRWEGSRYEVAPFAGVNNLFDENYSGNVRLNAIFGRYYEPAPGRNVFAGIEVRGLY